MTDRVIQELGEGLVLRRATAADAERLVAFNADLHREPGSEEPQAYVAAWTRDLLARPHPTCRPGDFTYVEDTRSGQIVSSLCLISQTWSYGGIAFCLGRPELVGTHPDYRRRGLIRAQMDLIHAWSAGRGERVQAITGIPWYYRQFGYEMAVTLGGGRLAYRRQVPELKDGEQEPYTVRPATAADLPFIARLYAHGVGRYPLACLRDEALWRYELAGRSEKNVNRRALSIVEEAGGQPLGLLIHADWLWKDSLSIWTYELAPGVSWLAVAPSAMRALWALGEARAAEDPKQEMEALYFSLGPEHPLFEVSRDRLPHTRPPYAWYLRVPDLPGFLRHVAPVLERRLAASALVGHTGELKVSFYRDGLRLAFEEGRLAGAEPWQPTIEAGGDAALPDLTFLQLLFGYRSLGELKHAFADCWTGSDEAQVLLEVLFPKQPSNLWPVS